MAIPAKGTLLCVLLVCFGFILSAGCVFDTQTVPPADDGSAWDEDGNRVSPESGSGDEEDGEKTETSYNTMNGRGYLEVPAENGSTVYARDVYGEEAVDDTGDLGEEEENDYAIDGEEVSSDRNPLDAIKDLDEYDVQDNGSTIILDTDSGDIAY